MLSEPTQTLSALFQLAIKVIITLEDYCQQNDRIVSYWNLERLSVRTKFMRTKFSNATSVGKNLNFNQVRGRVTLLPSLFFSHYALLVTEAQASYM